MARSHAIVHSSILEALKDRSVGAQLLYRQLLERPERGTLGVIPYRPRSWAKYMPGATEEDVEGFVVELEAHDFLVVDRDELECVHRTHMHHDGVLKQAQIVMAAAKQRHSVESEKVGAAVDAQIPPELRDRWPDAIANGKRAEVQAWLEECGAASYKPSRPPPRPPEPGWTQAGASLELGQRQAPGTGPGPVTGVRPRSVAPLPPKSEAVSHA